MMENNYYFMRGDKGPVGPFQLSEGEAERLRNKDWLVVPFEMVNGDLHGHLHIVDENGQYLGARVLDCVQAGEHRRLGHHLIHVGDAAKDIDEVRAILGLRKGENE